MTAEETSSSKEIRRNRVRRLVRRLLIWVVVPTLVGIVYYGFMASSQYESTALVSVRANRAGKTSRAKEETMQVKEYALSRAMLASLSERHGYIEHYQSSDADFRSRLGGLAGSEEAYEYFLEHTDIEYQSASGSLRINIRAFSGEAARKFVQAIIQESESMANNLDSRPANDLLVQAQEQATLAMARLEEAIQESAKIEQAISSKQLAVPDPGLDSLDIQKRTAKVKQDLARERYKTTQARVDSLQSGELEKRFYITVISPPSLSSGSVYPRRLWSILSVFVVALVFMAVMTMLAATVKEHARF